MTTNMLLSIVCAVGLIGTVIVVYIINSRKEEVKTRKEYKVIFDIVNSVKEYMAELIGEDISVTSDDEEFERLYERKALIQASLKKSTFGIASAKQVIKDIIKQFIKDNLYMSEVDSILGLDDNSYPSDHVMFEMLMQHYMVQYGRGALKALIVKYGWDQERFINGDSCYYVGTDDLHRVFEKENLKFSEGDKITLLATLVYQIYRGFGILDTLRDMDIDGVNIGTSGSILTTINSNVEKTEATEAVRSCWLYLDGKYIHLRFMNFTSEDEIKRIITMLVRYGSKGSLTERRGYMVTTMADKSRLLAMRPGMGEYWAAWIRKFTLKNVTIESLVNKEYVKNGQLPCRFIKFLMLGQMTSIVTGRQGSGKTTLMTAMIEFVDRRYNIRVIELAPELYLRELYSDRNVYSAQQTNYVSATDIQAAFKKSDAAFSLLGEISDASLAARYIEFTMTASLFSIASHHANTTRELVLALRNCLIDSGAFSNMETAEAQVLECVKFDIHLDYTPDGKRYVDYISEIVPFGKREYAEFKVPVPSKDDYETVDEYMAAMKHWELCLAEHRMAVDRDYYTRRTDREDFEVNQILHYDLETDTYVIDHRVTDARMKEMTARMGRNNAMEFEKFIISNWGTSADDAEMIDLGRDDEREEDEALLQGINGLDIASDDEIEDIIDMRDGIDALKLRDSEGFESGDNTDVFGDKMTDEEFEAYTESAAESIADLYAPHKK